MNRKQNNHFRFAVKQGLIYKKKKGWIREQLVHTSYFFLFSVRFFPFLFDELWAGRALTFRKFPEKMDIGSKKMYLQEVCEGGQKNQGHVTFPIKSRAVVGDIWKNGQNFGDLNFHKI